MTFLFFQHILGTVRQYIKLSKEFFKLHKTGYNNKKKMPKYYLLQNREEGKESHYRNIFLNLRQLIFVATSIHFTEKVH